MPSLAGSGVFAVTSDAPASRRFIGLGLDPVRVARIAGHASVTMTLNLYADELDKAHHQDDLFARINKAGFGAV